MPVNSYDEEIRYIDPAEQIRASYVHELIETLRQKYPHYADPAASVTPDFIKHIEQAQEDEWNTEEIEVDEEYEPIRLTDKQCQQIVEELSFDKQTAPLESETIMAILDRMNELITQAVMQQSADENSDDSIEDSAYINNRGNDLSCLGRYDEALAAYNKACELDPEYPTAFMNRAGLFLSLGMKDEALADARHAQANIPESSTEYLSWNCQLAEIYFKCDEDELALTAMIKFFEAFNEAIHYQAKDSCLYGINTESIEYDGSSMDYAFLVENTAECIKRIKEIEKRNAGDFGIQAMISDLKIAILTLRVKANF